MAAIGIGGIVAKRLFDAISYATPRCLPTRLTLPLGHKALRRLASEP